VLFCLHPYYISSCYYPLHIICFLHLLSTNHKCTRPCYSPLLLQPALRRWRWTGILWWGVLGYALPWLLFLWCYGVFRCFLVFRDIIYVIKILYSWHLAICEHFWTVCVEQLILGIHIMSIWLWHKNRVWQKWYQSLVNHRIASLDRRVLSLILFLVFPKKYFCSNFLLLLLIYKTGLLWLFTLVSFSFLDDEEVYSDKAHLCATA
jgi:hypothetical protein